MLLLGNGIAGIPAHILSRRSPWRVLQKLSRHYAYPTIFADNIVRDIRDPKDKGAGQLEPARGKFAKFLVESLKDRSQGNIRGI